VDFMLDCVHLLMGPNPSQHQKIMSVQLDLDLESWIQLKSQGDHEALCKEFIRVFTFFSNNTYLTCDEILAHRINSIVQNFLHIFTSPDFRVPVKFADTLIFLNPTIANLVSISDFKTTDPWMELVWNQEENLLKVITLYSARNLRPIDPSILFRAHPVIASKWWVTCWFSSECFCNSNVYGFFQKHLAQLSDQFQLYGPGSSAPYFFVTYVDPQRDSVFKSRFNSMVQNTLGNVIIKNEPDPRHIAIATSKWFSGSAVYKCLHEFLATLKPAYRLSLIHLGRPRDDLETSLFDEVISVKFEGSSLDLSGLQSNTFSLLYYPDIGMDYEGKFLSNLRLAPIQTMGYGHPVSTFGSKIDYFIGGQTVENLDSSSESYSERLVLIPGMGVHPVFPTYIPAPGTKAHWHEDHTGKFIINCSWGSRKINYPLLKTLLKIKDRTHEDLLFRFFPGPGVNLLNSYLPIQRDLEELFGKEQVSLIPQVSYKVYMDLMNEGVLSLDAYPFGGYNTILDSLVIGKPIITWEGERAFNRIASALMRQIGLSECIATSEEEYIERAVELINSEQKLQSLKEKIHSLDLHSKVFHSDQPSYFKKAIDLLMEKHGEFQTENSRNPILIT
jgi:hypothetical protein